KPNSNPIQTQFKPNQSQNKPNTNPKQTQSTHTRFSVNSNSTHLLPAFLLPRQPNNRHQNESVSTARFNRPGQAHLARTNRAIASSKSFAIFARREPLVMPKNQHYINSMTAAKQCPALDKLHKFAIMLYCP
ncbi:MAG: hypothetical protein ACYSSN_04185, partial [Planctomycetota bacterium]